MMPVTIDFAGPADDVAIRRLVKRESVPGRITVTFEREPDFSLGCAVTGEDCRILVARAAEDGEVVGVACRSVRHVFVNGREQRLGYLGQLRVDERFRGRWLVARGFRLLRQIHDEDPVPAYLASIIGGNPEAAGVLVGRRRKSFPNFHTVADYCTLAIDVQRPKGPVLCNARISPASTAEAAELAEFLRTHGSKRQFFPVWTEQSLRSLDEFGLKIEDLRIARRGREIAGVVGLWDQSAYKQTVVKSYSGWLRAVAPLWNSSAPWLGRNALPHPGEKLLSAYAALICVANDDLAVFGSLLREIYNLARLRGLNYLLVGLDARDPLLPVARAYAHVRYPSTLYLAEWSEGGHLHEQLDERPAYVDAATL
ncbi:MAG TPA: hypothetical protein VF532_20385 [Candidatus Angelobacter sp.]